jgi:hypothetical protein
MAFWKRLARALNPGTPHAHDDWKLVWDARQAALEGILGPADDSVFHAVIPLDLGGGADVLAFTGPGSGHTYVTADLTGQPILGQAQVPTFELMICTRLPSEGAPNLISRLAPYCLEKRLAPGHTMQVSTDPQAPMYALVFTTPDWITSTFPVLGQACSLLLAIGISKADLEYAFSDGTEALLARLRERGSYPYTPD